MSDFNHEIEKHIAKATIKALLGAGYVITVNDGEEEVLTRSADAGAIFAAMMSTGEDVLFLNMLPDRSRTCGWVRFIYGNCGWEVINDFTTNLEQVLAPVNAMAEKLCDGDFSAMWPVPLLDRKVTGHYGDAVCTVAEFIDDNKEALSVEEVLFLLQDIEAKGEATLGGGAHPMLVLRVVEG